MLFALSPGVITILCHGESLFSPDFSNTLVDSYLESLAHEDGFAFAVPLSDAITDRPDKGVVEGPPPQANDDAATTPEEVPVTIDVLGNDRSGEEEDDDDKEQDRVTDNDTAQIDRSSVDLDPEAPGLQTVRATPQGLYSVDDGWVTFAPELNFFGSSSIQYTVRSRGGETSNLATVSVSVSNINDAPLITGVAVETLDAMAGQPITLTLDHLHVIDPDGDPNLLMVVLPGANYTYEGNVVTPDDGYSGQLPVQVQVSDGAAASGTSQIILNVTEQENQPPTITGQNAVVTPEDVARTIVAGDLIISDADGTAETVYTVHPQEGDNYTIAGTTITPALNFNGTLTVPVTVDDGQAMSEVFNLNVEVSSVNDLPVITGQSPDPLTTGEGRALAIDLSNLVVTDPDHPYPTGFTLTVLDGTHYNVSGNTITPAAGFTGSLSVNVSVADPEGGAASGTMAVSVTANSPPVITGQTALSTNEETSVAISLANLTVTDPDNVYPTDFTLKISSGANYEVSGELITPAPNFTGVLIVPVVVNDGINDSAPFDLQITVQNTNDPPVISGQVALSTAENQALTLNTSQLTITDPDNDPATLALSILAGDNYSVNGHTITPSAGFNGMLSVRVFVSDGLSNSNFFDVQISVTPINDVPVITGQQPLSMMEGTSISLVTENVTVHDADNTYPTDFTLIVQPGENYIFAGNTVTPSPDFNGILSVNVVVSDGVSNSSPFAMQISINPVNDPPQITAHQVVSTNEDTPRTITVADIVVTDPDNASGFALSVFPGDNYTLLENTITPLPDYFGPLTVQVQVSDGELTSNIYNLPVQVIAVNDRPVITGQVPIQTAEDSPVTIELAHLTVFDRDNTYPSGFSLIVSAGTNYTVSGSTVVPSTDFNGTLNVNVAVSDGQASSDPFVFQIQVGNANDAPQITGQVAVSTDEETPITLSLSHLSVFDPDNAFPTGFTLLVSPGVNYTVSGTTITPAVNFAGLLTVPLRVNDGVNNSASFDFQLQVNPINDPPSFAAIANQQLAENAPAGSILIRDISKGPLEDDQQLTFIANSSNTAVIEDPVIQYNPGSPTAVLSYVVKPNTSGVVTLTVVAIDNGSNTAPHQNSYTASFQVEVLEINTPPTLDVINNINIMEDAELQNITLSGISAGAGETQSLMVSATANKPELLEQLEVVYTSPAATGLLRFKTKPNVFGSINVSVTVTDNGSGVSPNVNTMTRSFTVIIQPVNDVPVFTSSPALVAVIGETYEYRVSASDPDGDRVTIGATGKPSWATLSGSGNGQALLHGKPPDGTLGDTPVTLSASDGSAVAQQSFKIFVNVRPSLTNLSAVTEEDKPAAFPANFFTAGYSDRNENALQNILITSLPVSGRLLLSDREVQAGDTIVAASLSQLVYEPGENFFGDDTFGWNAFDGYHYSQSPARVDITVVSVNDPPSIVLANDTLYYEVEGEAATLSPMLDIIDPDDDTLSRASIRFFAGYRPNMELLEFDATPGISVNFDFQTGMLEFSGTASLAQYRTALRSVRYLYQNTLDPILEPKGVYYTVHDGEAESERASKVIILQYTFVEFEIPSAFTPNGDHANDTWVIDRPGGGLEEMDKAVISVYNKQGVLVYRARGFDRPWDGTHDGELLPSDTYFFTIDLQLRNQKTYKGIVTILR